MQLNVPILNLSKSYISATKQHGIIRNSFRALILGLEFTQVIGHKTCMKKFTLNKTSIKTVA